MTGLMPNVLHINLTNTLLQMQKDPLQNKDQPVSQVFKASTTEYKGDIVKLTAAQKAMLEMSEDDIRQGNLISQKIMDKRNFEWLEAM